MCYNKGIKREEVNVMGMRKAIEHGKEHRKPYYGSKDFDRTCRNHGGCPWCEENRKHKFIVREKRSLDKLNEYYFELSKEDSR